MTSARIIDAHLARPGLDQWMAATARLCRRSVATPASATSMVTVDPPGAPEHGSRGRQRGGEHSGPDSGGRGVLRRV